MKPALIEQHTATDKRTAKLDPGSIETRGLQTRDGTDAATVATYAEIYRAGGSLPPIVVFEEQTGTGKSATSTYWLGDGHHRLAAAKRAELDEIDAIVKRGDRRDALWYASAANAQHGLPRTNEDKRRAVALILADEEWRQLSDAQLAEHVQVSDRLVAKVRKEIGATVAATKGRDGAVRRKPVARATRAAARLDVGERYDRALAVLAAEGSGFDRLHAHKIAILAACYAALKPLTREQLREITGHAPDTHLATLAKKNLITGWPDGPVQPSPTTRARIADAVEAAARTTADGASPRTAVSPKTGPHAWSLDPDFDIGRHLLGWISGLDTDADGLANITGLSPAYCAGVLDTLAHHGLMHRDDDVMDEQRWEITEAGQIAMRREKSLVCATNAQVRTWMDKHSVQALAQASPTPRTVPSADDAEQRRELRAGAELLITASATGNFEEKGLTWKKALILTAMADWPALQDYALSRADLGRMTGLTVADINAQLTGSIGGLVHETDESTLYITETTLAALKAILTGDTHRTGPEEVTTPPPPAATPPAAPAAVRPLALRRVDKQRDLIAVELGQGKARWTGTDNDLFLLGLICGVPTRAQAWIDNSRAQARDLFIDALRGEVAERVRSGEAANTPKWPSIRELCALWGLDFASIEIRAERAVPE